MIFGKRLWGLIAASLISCFSLGSNFASQPLSLQENASRAYFSSGQSRGDSTDTDREAPQRLLVEQAENPTVAPADPIEQTIEELENWQLVHSRELPFDDYFIDTRIIGAVRYHADFSLEKEYDILRELTNIQKDLSQYLAIPRPKETVELFLFQSNDAYQKFLAKEFPEAPYDRRALYIKQSGPGMVLIVQSQDMKEDLRHEMTHAFLHAAVPYIPLWLDEGLAEYFEKPRESRANENSYFKSVAKKTMFGRTPSLARLETLVYFDQMGVNEYCEAWSWVHFMMHHSRDTHEMLAGYIQLLAQLGEKTPTLETYMAKVVPDSKKAYQEHFRNWQKRGTEKPRTQIADQKSDYEQMEPQSERKKNETGITRGWTESLFR